jgi:hypothetical protein
MKKKMTMTVLSWFLRLLAAIISLQTLFKITAATDSLIGRRLV